MNPVIEINYEAYGKPDHKGEFDPEKLQKALDWTLKTFDKLIISEMPNPDVPIILFVTHTVTEEDNLKGLFVYPQGTQVRYTLKAEIFAKLYMSIILDDRIKYDKGADHEDKASDKIEHIIAFDKHFYVGHEKYIRLVRERGLI